MDAIDNSVVQKRETTEIWGDFMKEEDLLFRGKRKSV